MNHKLAIGKIVQGKNLNYLLIKDDYTGVTRNITYNINYDIEKILRENYMGKTIQLGLSVKVIRD